MLTALEANY